MTNEVRLYTDEQVKEVFKTTKKTADLTVNSIEYNHYELFPDSYHVNTDKGKYMFQVASNYSWKGNRNYSLKNRIVKIK